MIDEKKLLEKLNKELDTAKSRFNECEDFDYFYAAVCSALETTIKLVEREPKITVEHIKQQLNWTYGNFTGNGLRIIGKKAENEKGYFDTDSVRINGKEVENE